VQDSEKSNFDQNFGAAVRKWREALKLSQEQLAKRAGLHRTYICDIERGARNISLEKTQKLAKALSIPLVTLLADLEPKLISPSLRPDELVDILIVEDDATDAALTVEHIKDWSISNRVYVAADGLAALNFLFGVGEFSHRLATDKPRLILLDLKIPKIDGLEMLRRIKADPRTQSIPVVILTASQHERDMAECKRLGVHNYILKPITQKNFSETSLKLDLQWAMLKSVVPPS
jgi:two-component system, response regulator